MLNEFYSVEILTARRRQLSRRAVFVLGLLLIPQMLFAQTAAVEEPQVDKPVIVAASATASPTPDGLTERERAMLELIKQLQERVTKLEASQAAAAPTAARVPPQLADKELKSAPVTDSESVPATDLAKKDDDGDGWGSYTENLGYKLADTEYGDLNLSIYTYVRYLNQRGLRPTYMDALGNIKNVQQRQDVQIQKLQFKFLGWMLNKKLRYFLYAWTSNATQGQGAQVVLAGNVSYTFNKYLTFAGGIRSLPGTRSVEGNFPFWLGVDSRLIADEFMRPSYTSGIWATGSLTDRLKYQVMVGNNMSTLGVSASRLDNGFNTFSSALTWFPTGDFERGFNGQGWGDFEHHDKFSTRLGFHFNRSDENKESQPASDTFENTQIRLSDGTVIFTPNLFGEGVTVTDVRWRMATVDGGFKYRGFSLEGEYYWRWLDNFRGINVEAVPEQFDHGYQLQGSAMLVPRTWQLYLGQSMIFGNNGNPWDFRVGMNWFPFKTKVLRWNTEGLYLRKSPVGYTSVPFAVGGTGWVFHSSVELAF